MINNKNNHVIIKGFEMRRLKLWLYFHLIRLLMMKSTNPVEAIRLLRKIRKKYRSMHGEKLLIKAAKVDNRYYWRLGTPGFPSEAIKKVHSWEIDRIITGKSMNGLRTLFFAVTKKCPYNCEHCFEGDNLNKPEKLAVSDIIDLVQKYQEYGVSQIIFSGGEPLQRVKDIYRVLEESRNGTDFWIFTSGFGLDLDCAKQLKKLGLTGTIVSIDHFDETKNDKFRGFKGALNIATQSVIDANKAGLVTSLSLCATNEFINKENLKRYMDLARELGVSFVQLLEPRKKGRYLDKEVELNEDKIELLEKTYLDYNSLEKYSSFPIVNYLGYHQKRVGCFGSGNRYFYIDTDGDAHICPYCNGKVGSSLEKSPREIISMLNKESCHVYSRNTDL